MNQVTLIGRLTADPEISYTKGEKPLCVAKYSLAVARTSPKQGEQDTDFIPCRALKNKGEFAGKYFKKGLRVAVSGELRIDSYKDEGGNTRYSTYVLLSSQEFADGKQNEGAGNGSGRAGGNQQQGNYQQPPNQPYQNNGYNGQRSQNQNGYNQGGYNQGYNQNGYNGSGYNNQGQYNNNHDFN